jgi:hypothetical protein
MAKRTHGEMENDSDGGGENNAPSMSVATTKKARMAEKFKDKTSEEILGA